MIDLDVPPVERRLSPATLTRPRWATMTVAAAKAYAEEGHFAPGSMLPKIEAAIYYLGHGGQEVLITNPENITRALAGATGTRIVP